MSLTYSESEWKLFWDQFLKALGDCGAPFITQAPCKHWCHVKIESNVKIEICLINSKNKVYVGLNIKDDKVLYDALFQYKGNIERELGLQLIWDRLDNKGTSKIGYDIVYPALDFDDHSNYDELFKIIIDITSKMKKVFEKYVKKIKA